MLKKIILLFATLTLLGTGTLPLAHGAGPVGLTQARSPLTRELGELWFGMRVNEAMVDWFNQTARADDVAAVTAQEVALLERITAGRKQVLFTSVAEAEQLVPTLADQMDIIGYDLEHWPQTPADEQADPLAAVQRLQALARQYDLSLALGPDRRFAVDYGAAMAPYADKFSLQLQRLQADPDALLAFAQPLIQELRQANPDLEINIQLRTEGSLDQLLAIIAALQNDINGVSIIYSPESVTVAQELVSRLRSTTPGVAASATSTPTPATPGVATATPTSFVQPSPLPQAPASSGKLWFGMRVNEAMVDWFNRNARPEDIAAVGVREVALLERITAGRKQVLFTSVAEAEQLVPTLADKMDIIGYDLEHWPQTPADEQADPLAAVQRLQALARQYDLSLALGPDRRFALDYGAAMAPYADKFSLQLQRLQADPDALLAFAQPLIQELRQANPDLEINIQLRTEGSLDQLLAIIAALQNDINGVSIIYNPATVDMAKEMAGRLQAQAGAPTGATPAATGPAPTPATPVETLELAASPTPAALVAPSLMPAVQPTRSTTRSIWLAGLLAAVALAGGVFIVLMIRRRRRATELPKDTHD